MNRSPYFSCILIIILVFYLMISCDNNNFHLQKPIINTHNKIIISSNDSIKEVVSEPHCYWDSLLQAYKLVNILLIDPTLAVDLKYTGIDNFMGKDVYGCLNNCYLQPEVAEKLKAAQHILQKEDSTLGLLIWDGARPRSVQQYMWDMLEMPAIEKINFVSNPKLGSLHNFGAAVDVTILNKINNVPLDMGTPYDYFGILAWPIKEKEMLKDSRLNKDQINNRRLLRKVMSKAGFYNIQTEWWHFNSMTRNKAAKKFKIIEGLIKS